MSSPYQGAARAAISVLAVADAGVDPPAALGAALGPGSPGRPEDGLGAGHPLVTEPGQGGREGERGGGREGERGGGGGLEVGGLMATVAAFLQPLTKIIGFS